MSLPEQCPDRESHVSDERASLPKPLAPPAKAGSKSVAEGGKGASEETSSSQPTRPASVREGMQPQRRYDPRRPRVQPVPRSRKPVPARGSPAPPPARAFPSPVAPEEESREVEVGGEVWTIRIKGEVNVGSRADSGPRLLSVAVVAPGARPNPERLLYVLAKQLDEVPEAELAGLVREVVSEPDVASGSAARRGKPGGGARYRRRHGS